MKSQRTLNWLSATLGRAQSNPVFADILPQANNCPTNISKVLTVNLFPLFLRYNVCKGEWCVVEDFGCFYCGSAFSTLKKQKEIIVRGIAGLIFCVHISFCFSHVPAARNLSNICLNSQSSYYWDKSIRKAKNEVCTNIKAITCLAHSFLPFPHAAAGNNHCSTGYSFLYSIQ